MELTELLVSYESDFQHNMEFIEKLCSGTPAEATALDQAFSECQRLIKQIEVEGMNYIEDDSIRKRVSFDGGLIAYRSVHTRKALTTCGAKSASFSRNVMQNS